MLQDSVSYFGNFPKGAVILNNIISYRLMIKDLSTWERPNSYQLVGEVMAHQGSDG